MRVDVIFEVGAAVRCPYPISGDRAVSRRLATGRLGPAKSRPQSSGRLSRLPEPRLVIYTDFSYRTGGDGVTAELPFVLFINALSARGMRITVAGRLDSAKVPYPFSLDSDIEFVGLPGYGSLAHADAVARASRATLGAFANHTRDADAVWLFGPHPFALGFAAIARRRRQPVILGVRQDLPALMARRRPEHRWVRRSAQLLETAYRTLARRYPTVVVGPALAKSYGSATRLLNLPISLVSTAQIVDPAVALGRSYEGELTAISVGRIDPEKNPLLLADVLSELRSRDPRWRLEVYGEGMLLDALGGRLEQLDLSPHAKLCGYLPIDQGLQQAYRASHAFLHVSWTEGVPQVLYEAFAAGLPVVATAVGGVADAVGDAALLVPAGDAQAPAEALARIGRDAAIRAELVERGSRRVAGLTLERQAEKALAFIAECLQ
jgi:glycosyltransferase involved in cell wall biosynthesis